MYNVIARLPNGPTREVHCYSEGDMQRLLLSHMAESLLLNRGFVYMEDVGASGPAIQFNGGLTVEVIKC